MPALQYCRINVNCLIDVTVRSVHRILILMVILTAVLSVGGLLPHATVRADEFNYDESRVPEFTLPDPLVTLSGEPVATGAVERDAETGNSASLRRTRVRQTSGGRRPSSHEASIRNIVGTERTGSSS